jgi:hypothetical protein
MRGISAIHNRSLTHFLINLHFEYICCKNTPQGNFERKAVKPFKAPKALKGFFLQLWSMAALVLGFNDARIHAFVDARQGNCLI